MGGGSNLSREGWRELLGGLFIPDDVNTVIPSNFPVALELPDDEIDLDPDEEAA
jgi:hypothetical protein